MLGLGIREEQQAGQRSPPTSFTLEESLQSLAPYTCDLSSAAPAEKCWLESQGLPQPSVHSVPRLPGSQRTGAFTGQVLARRTLPADYLPGLVCWRWWGWGELEDVRGQL